MPEESLPEKNGRMPTTKWTLLAKLGEADEAVSRPALEQLCRSYRYPLYCHIRRFGLDHHDAEDALQDFFSKLLRNGTFAQADAGRGRLRSLLLVSLNRFLATRGRAEGRRRERERRSMSEDVGNGLDARFEREGLADGAGHPDEAFDRHWARELVRLSLERLRLRYAERGRADLFDKLLPVLESGGSLVEHDTARLAAELSMRPGTLRTSLHRLLADYRDELERQVVETVGDREAAQAELELLARLFS
jgi:DNA-directed RNA polymerase specialized sigma24 family protein